MTLPKGYKHNKPERRDYQDDLSYEDDIMRYMNGQPPLGPNVRRFNTQEEVDAFNRQQPQPPPSPPSNKRLQSSPSSSGDVKAGVWIVCFFGGFILVIITIITLNIYTMIFGFILFAIGVGWMSWAQGSHAAKQHNNRHTNASTGWSDVYMNRWGSANAKRNMRRGHRYSKRK